MASSDFFKQMACLGIAQELLKSCWKALTLEPNLRALESETSGQILVPSCKLQLISYLCVSEG